MDHFPPVIFYEDLQYPLPRWIVFEVQSVLWCEILTVLPWQNESRQQTSDNVRALWLMKIKCSYSYIQEAESVLITAKTGCWKHPFKSPVNFNDNSVIINYQMAPSANNLINVGHLLNSPFKIHPHVCTHININTHTYSMNIYVYIYFLINFGQFNSIL